MRRPRWLNTQAAPIHVSIIVLALTTVSCERLGYTNRILHRVPSPVGSMVAVCQEIPQLDGPGYSVRLERPDGTALRTLYEIGDGDPCSEIAWAPDGRTIGVLSGHVARVIVVDVERVLQRADETTLHPSRHARAMLPQDQHLMAWNLVFTDPDTMEVEACPYRIDASRRTGRMVCTEPAVVRVLSVPRPAYLGKE